MKWKTAVYWSVLFVFATYVSSAIVEASSKSNRLNDIVDANIQGWHMIATPDSSTRLRWREVKKLDDRSAEATEQVLNFLISEFNRYYIVPQVSPGKTDSSSHLYTVNLEDDDIYKLAYAPLYIDSQIVPSKSSSGSFAVVQYFVFPFCKSCLDKLKNLPYKQIDWNGERLQLEFKSGVIYDSKPTEPFSSNIEQMTTSNYSYGFWVSVSSGAAYLAAVTSSLCAQIGLLEAMPSCGKCSGKNLRECRTFWSSVGSLSAVALSSALLLNIPDRLSRCCRKASER